MELQAKAIGPRCSEARLGTRGGETTEGEEERGQMALGGNGGSGGAIGGEAKVTGAFYSPEEGRSHWAR